MASKLPNDIPVTLPGLLERLPKSEKSHQLKLESGDHESTQLIDEPDADLMNNFLGVTLYNVN